MAKNYIVKSRGKVAQSSNGKHWLARAVDIRDFKDGGGKERGGSIQQIGNWSLKQRWKESTERKNLPHFSKAQPSLHEKENERKRCKTIHQIQWSWCSSALFLIAKGQERKGRKRGAQEVSSAEQPSRIPEKLQASLELHMPLLKKDFED